MHVSDKTIRAFQKTVWEHWQKHGRHNMPWRHTTDPYRIVVSEVMLQQTQVSRVEGKYAAFVKRFPNWRALAAASVADVLSVWQGLGYNRRALALRDVAQIVMKKYKGKLPSDPTLLDALPGIGAGTAGSICAFAFNKPVPFIETNIRRVYIHFFFPKKQKVYDDSILPLVELTMDHKRAREWFWALMDYGAMLASREEQNPNVKSAHYTRQSKFEGSHRQLRGHIIKLLAVKGRLSRALLGRALFGGATSKQRTYVTKALAELEKEGFIRKERGTYQLA